MNTPQPAMLRAEVLRLEGEDAESFAQAQFASDVSRLQAGAWQWSSWLDATGRVRALFHLMRDADGVLHALLRGGSATAFGTALGRFTLRARLRLLATCGGVLRDGPPLPAHTAIATSQGREIGFGDHRVIWPCITDHDESGDTWRIADIRDGHPWLPDSLLEHLLPPALGLYRLGAVALDKGCYPGQEIVARLHWRGGHKQHLHRIVANDAWHEGQRLTAGGRELGIILNQADNEALAIVRDEERENPDLPPILQSYGS